MKLRQALQGCSSSQLARIVTAWGLHVEAGTLRRELVEQVAAWLEREGQEPAFWGRFSSQEERTLLGALARAGGRHDADLLVRRLTAQSPAGADGETEQRALQSGISSLLDRGVLYRMFDAAGERQGVSLILPDELLDPARQSLGYPDAPDGALPVESPGPGGEVVRCDPAADLFVLASALRREIWGAPSRGLAGRPARSVGRILTLLGANDRSGPGQPSQRWRFLLWVAQRAGWIDRSPLPRPNDDALLQLLRAPGLLPARALEAGPASSAARGIGSPAQSSARPQRLQPDVLQLLNELPGGPWWTPSDLADWAATQLTRTDSDAGRADRLVEQRRRSIERWLAGRWYWLGLVEWGQTAGGDFRVVRPTSALRSAVTGRAATADVSAHAACRADADLTLVAPRGADLATLYRAEAYLTYRGSTAQGRAYRLTPPSFERGLRLGGSFGDLERLVAQLTGTPIPNAWRTTIERWSRAGGRLRLSAALILAADDAQSLADALTQVEAREAIAEQLSPTHVRVDGTQVARLLAELAAAGWPVDIDAGVRAEPAHAGRAAALSGSAAEAAWIGLEIARRLAPEVVDGQRDLGAARQQLEAIFSEARLEALSRRVASIMAAAGHRKRPPARRRVV